MRADVFFLLINEIDDALVIEATGDYSSPERAEFKKGFSIKGIIAAAACFAALAVGIFMIVRVRMSGTFSPGDSAVSANESSANAVEVTSSESAESSSFVESGSDSSTVSGNDSSSVTDVRHEPLHTVTSEPVMFFKEPKPEDIVYDTEHNVSYVKNQLLISALLDTPKEKIEQLAKELDAEIVGYIEITNDYQIEFLTDKTLDELEAAADYLNSFSFVENVTLNLSWELPDCTAD